MPQELLRSQEVSPDSGRASSQNSDDTGRSTGAGPGAGEQLPSESGARRIDAWAVRQFLSVLGDPPVAIRLPTGQEISPSAQPDVLARVCVRDRASLMRLLFRPQYHFPEGYASGALEVEGLEYLLREVLMRYDRGLARSRSMETLSRWLKIPKRNSLRRSRTNIYQHYDLGNDFYRLWLDEQMVYTCAYFPESNMSLEQAQIAKMDHVSRKVGLRPGMRVIEAGCGWGGLALHMAKNYGVRVRAYNISKSQIAWARDAAARQGLEDRVEFIEDDWRNIRGECDAFVSVGMLEHVGLENYARLGDVIHRCLLPEGLGIIHSIAQSDSRPLNPWIEEKIFPGAYPPTLAEIMSILEPHRFAVLDVENLRLHYAETLRHWLHRFENSADTIREEFDEAFVRAWRFYLTGSAVGFESGSLQLLQVVFAPDSKHDLPRSRRYLYSDQAVANFEPELRTQQTIPDGCAS